MVIVDVPAPGAAIGLGLKLTVAPVGAPEAERVIALLKPLLTVVVRVEVPWLPCTTVTADGEATKVKLGGGVTVSLTVAVCCTPPPLPVTVIV
jgi:hypothetical protein